MDLRIIISGCKPWELGGYFSFFGEMKGLRGIYTIMNFVPESAEKDMTDVLKDYGITDIFFAKYAPDPFCDDCNSGIYAQICKMIIDAGNGVLQPEKKRLFGGNKF